MAVTKSARFAGQPFSAAALARENARVAQTLIEPNVRHAMITEAAYFRAQRRGFAPGHEIDDWLAAEIEVDTALMNTLLK